MTGLRMLGTKAPRGYNQHAYRFGGALTSALIASADCLTATIEGAFIATAIEKAGSGDYVEVGCGFGGTAILAAITKKVFNIPGKVVSIDSFVDLFHTYEHAMRNITGWGLQNHIELIQASSYPWPLSLDRKFAIGYVDGGHRDDMPYHDLTNMGKCVEKCIMVHDYDINSKDVVRGANRFADENPEWKVVAGKKRIVAFEKMMP